MRQPVDVLVDSTISAVANSGLVEEVARMGTVTAVNAGGTVDVSVGNGQIPTVRLLSGYNAPAAGDLVEIMRTSGGWVCLGRLVTETQGPQLQAGTGATPSASGWSSVVVSFPVPFSSVPIVTVTPATTNPGIGGNADWRMVISATSTTAFTAQAYREASAPTAFRWIAVTT